MVKSYNILWLDDDFDRNSDNYTSLEDTKNDIIKYCEEYGHLNIETTSNSKEFERMLSSYYDAVILDVRGKKEGSEEKTSKAEAFYYAVKAIRTKKYTGIKFILSGQAYVTENEDETFMDSLSALELSKDYILDKRKWLKQVVPLGRHLIQCIDEANTTEHQVRNLYPKAYEAALDLGKGDFFCELFKEDLDNATIIDNLEGFRDVIEKMKDSLCNKNIIPPITNLNQIVPFFKGEMTIDGYLLRESYKNKFFHQVHIRELSCLLDISNDAKHSKEDLALHVRDYVESYGDINVLRAMTHILVSLLRRYKEIMNEYEYNPFAREETWEQRVEATNVEVKATPTLPDFYFVEYTNAENEQIRCLLKPKEEQGHRRHIDCYGIEIEIGDRIVVKTRPGQSSVHGFTAAIHYKEIIKLQ